MTDTLTEVGDQGPELVAGDTPAPTRHPLEVRTASVAEVKYPQRLVELLVQPYEQEAAVEYRHRMIIEVCSRGAYEGVETRARRVRVNRDHDRTRTCGKTVMLNPSPTEGLIGEVYIAPTDLGDETLELAAAGCLDVSSGFRVLPNGERWTGRDHRRLEKVWLDHIAFTPDPAYLEAGVLNVRSNSPEPTNDAGVLDRPSGLTVAGTPNLDIVRGWLAEDRYSAGA
jgi:HK97 family phage prohead protease